ncbi:MAG: M1 family aminopeptidase [Gemmatimonadota bacterium]
MNRSMRQFVQGRVMPASILLWLSLSPKMLVGQAAGKTDPVAATFDARYQEIMALEPRGDQSAAVSNLVIERDAGQFTLESGRLYLLSSVGGRTVGAAFKGKGTFRFTSTSASEQDRLERFTKHRALEDAFSDLVLLFSDTTLAELQRKLTFGPDNPPGDLRGRIKEALEYAGEDDHKTLDADLLAALLNGTQTGMFVAHIGRDNGGPLMFTVNPQEVESVHLLGRGHRLGGPHTIDVVTQFRPKGSTAPAISDRTAGAFVARYTIRSTLNQTGSADLTYAADAQLELATTTTAGPWVPFRLYEQLNVDSARFADGSIAIAVKPHETSTLWVRLRHPLEPGATDTVRVFYHGDLIDRAANFFFIKSSSNWYPESMDWRNLAFFDLTFDTPEGYLLASVGQPKDSTVTARRLVTHWVTDAPIRNASFNLGQFKNFEVQEPGAPVVTLMFSDEAHRELARKFGIVQQKNMRQVVGNDVASSLRFFQSVYGNLTTRHMYATEIPYFEGLAFPGMIDLSWVTFQATDESGEDDIFRAHEVAHQWWGIGVDFATYHDQWLSEGFATFSGLWYLQTAQHDNKKYFDALERYRSSIMLRKDDPDPVAMGYRTSTADDRGGYDVVVYKKGAWVVHMLRIMMLDLKTMNEDRFTETMRDFYATYQGKRASTEDFRHMVEKHVGTDMGWFFDQWVYGASIPSYRVAYKTDPAENGQFRTHLRVDQQNVGDDFQAYVLVTADLGDKRLVRARVKVKGPHTEVDLPLMPAQPKSVQFNDFSSVLGDVKMVSW